VPAFAGKYDIPVWLTFGTIFEVGDRFDGIAQIFGFDSHDVFRIGDLEIHPFPVPHDAREPVQFVVSDGQHRLGLLTDIGGSTPYVQASLTGCSALVLECNHDRDLLATSDYPPSLKNRIAGRFGHLHNEAAPRSSRRSTRAACSTSSRRTVALEQHARRRRAPRLPARCVARKIGSASPTRPRASAGERWLTGDPWKSARALQGQGEDGLRDRRPELPRHALPRRRLGVRRRQARQARLKGRDQQQDQRVRHGQARAGGRCHAFRALAERARVAREGDEDGARSSASVRNVCAGSMAKRYGIEEGHRLPEPVFEFFLKSDALHDRCATTITSACSAGRRLRRSRRCATSRIASTPC
jgi:hypothetical protein